MNKNPVLAVYVGPGARRERLTFRVEGGLNYIRGNSLPHFSLTASGFDRGSEFGGCCHEIILEHYPKFVDLAAMHLSDMDGAPTHAAANGWYNLAGYFGGAGERYHVGNSTQHFPTAAPANKPWQNTEYREPTQDECLQIWADHIRIDIETARVAAARIAARWNWPDMKAAHAAFIEEQRPRWKQEAQACIVKHGLVVYGDSWTQAA